MVAHISCTFLKLSPGPLNLPHARLPLDLSIRQGVRMVTGFYHEGIEEIYVVLSVVSQVSICSLLFCLVVVLNALLFHFFLLFGIFIFKSYF